MSLPHRSVVIHIDGKTYVGTSGAMRRRHGDAEGAESSIKRDGNMKSICSI